MNISICTSVVLCILYFMPYSFAFLPGTPTFKSIEQQLSLSNRHCVGNGVRHPYFSEITDQCDVVQSATTTENVDKPLSMPTREPIPKPKIPLVKIVLLEKDLEEKFVRSTGAGGQKVNKSSNKVELIHVPTGLRVACQDARDLSTNRKNARKLMIAKLDLHFNGSNSKIGIKQDLIRKRKRNSERLVVDLGVFTCTIYSILKLLFHSSSLTIIAFLSLSHTEILQIFRKSKKKYGATQIILVDTPLVKDETEHSA